MGSGAGSGVLYVRGVTSAPNAPTDIAGTAGNTQVSLTWSAPASNGGAEITDYVVQYSSNGGTNWTTFNDGTSTSVSAVVTGLTNGTTYIFKVAAVNSVGTGNFSSQSSSLAPAVSGGATQGYNVAGASQVGVNGKYCQVGLHNNYPLYKGNVQYSGYDTYIYVSTEVYGYWVIGTRPYPSDDENFGGALFVSSSSSGVSPTPPLDAWEQLGGDPPSPTLSVTSCN
jgi:hypothetical protein